MDTWQAVFAKVSDSFLHHGYGSPGRAVRTVNPYTDMAKIAGTSLLMKEKKSDHINNLNLKSVIYKDVTIENQTLQCKSIVVPQN